MCIPWSLGTVPLHALQRKHRTLNFRPLFSIQSCCSRSQNTFFQTQSLLFYPPRSNMPNESDYELSDVKAKLMQSLEQVDVENESEPKDLLPIPATQKEALAPKTSQTVVLFWMAINTLATIGIVFTNKAIFSDKNLVKMPVAFAAFHFTCTSLTLFVVSQFGAFQPRRLKPLQILPLCFAFCGNVILPNLSLAFSSVTFYQLVRILLTPGTAGLNYVFYNTKISMAAVLAIVPICFGVGLTTYYDAISKTSETTTSVYGVVFALAGVTVSCVYTIWIGTFAKKYQVSSMQLLYNQAPWSVLLLLICVPFSDTVPPMAEISSNSMYLVLLSGAFAILINISQFFIIHGTSALTSTIVGHMKTCSIVALGWVFGGKMSNMSLLGVIIALSGIFTYSAIQQKK